MPNGFVDTTCSAAEPIMPSLLASLCLINPRRPEASYLLLIIIILIYYIIIIILLIVILKLLSGYNGYNGYKHKLRPDNIKIQREVGLC